MRRRTWIIAGVVAALAAGVAGVVSNAQGSTEPAFNSWPLLPKSEGKAVVPSLAGTSKLAVLGTDFTVASVDNDPSGTSQGDEITVTAQLLTTDGRKTGRLEVHEVITDARNANAPIVQITATVLLPGGQISAVGIQQANQQGTRLAIVGGTGQYYNVRGGQLTAGSAANNRTSLTFLLLRR
jgi:hypothetical protein